ncbi:MAG: hypothetical protein HON78_05840 [Legionellales bacterium]|jgi:hypothetical protein|nr:hypothetical protein [Legionellales bacterium]
MITGSEISKKVLKVMINKIELTAKDINNLENSEYIKKMLEPSSAKGKSFAPDECALLYALKNDNWSFLETIFKNKHKGVLFDFMTTASTMGIKKIKKGESPFCYLIRMKQWKIVAAFIKDLKEQQIEVLYNHYATGSDNTGNDTIMHYLIKNLDTSDPISPSLDGRTILTDFYELFNRVKRDLNPKNKDKHSPLSLAISIPIYAQGVAEIIVFFADYIKQKAIENMLNESYGEDENTIYDLLQKRDESSYGEKIIKYNKHNNSWTSLTIAEYVVKLGGRNSLGVTKDMNVEPSTATVTLKDVANMQTVSPEFPREEIGAKQNKNLKEKKDFESKRYHTYLTKTILGGLAGLGLAYFIVPMTINLVFLTAHFTLMAISLTIIGATLGFSHAYLNDKHSEQIAVNKLYGEACVTAINDKDLHDGSREYGNVLPKEEEEEEGDQKLQQVELTGPKNNSSDL